MLIMIIKSKTREKIDRFDYMNIYLFKLLHFPQIAQMKNINKKKNRLVVYVIDRVLIFFVYKALLESIKKNESPRRKWLRARVNKLVLD